MPEKRLIALIFIVMCLAISLQFVSIDATADENTMDPIVNYDLAEKHGFPEATAPRFQYLAPQTPPPAAESSEEATLNSLSMVLASAIMVGALGAAMAYIHWRNRNDGFDPDKVRNDAVMANLIVVAFFGLTVCSLGILFYGENVRAEPLEFVGSLGDDIIAVPADAGTNEIQLVTLPSAVTGGTFQLGFQLSSSSPYEYTDPLPYNAYAAQVDNKLEQLAVIGPDNVEVTGNPGGPFSIEFVGDLQEVNVSDIVVEGTMLTNGCTSSSTVWPGGSGSNQRQSITIHSAIAGTFRLGFRGIYTQDIRYDATAAEVEHLLNITPSIREDGGSVSVTGTAGGPWTVTFDDGPLADSSLPFLSRNLGNIMSASRPSLPPSTVSQTQAAVVGDPSTEHFYLYTAQDTGMLFFDAFFKDDDGNIDIEVLDSNTNVIAASTTMTDNEQVILPVVSQEKYFLRVFSVDSDPNTYDLGVENFPAPIPADIRLDPASDTGMMNNDNVTSDTTPRFLIHADLFDFDAMGIDILDAPEAGAGTVDGAAVQVFITNTTTGVSMSGYANSVGTSTILFDFTPSSALGDGVYMVSTAVRIFDGQRNLTGNPAPATGRSLHSELLMLTLDQTEPAVPSINLLDASDSGQDNQDNITNIMQPAFSGTGEPNNLIRLYAARKDPVTHLDIGPRELVGQSLITSQGTWEITVEPLIDDHYNFYGEQEDLAGNFSPLRIFHTNSLQQDVPDTPIISLISSISVAESTVVQDVRLEVDIDPYFPQELTIRLISPNGTGVDVIPPGGTFTDFNGEDSQGDWWLTLRDDQSGNINTLNGWSLEFIIYGLNVEIDTMAPQRPTLDLVATSDTGTSDRDNVTIGDPTQGAGILDFTVTSDADSEILIKDGNTVLNTTIGLPEPAAFNTLDAADGTVDGLATVTINFNTVQADLGIPAEGTHPLSAEAFDAAGNRSYQSEELIVEVDTTAPTATGVTFDMLDSSDSGNSDDDYVTNKMSPAFDGVARSGVTIRIYAAKIISNVVQPRELIGQTIVGSDESDGSINGLGLWEITSEPLVDGIYDLTFDLEDGSGNVVAIDSDLGVAGVRDIEIDTLAPQRPTLDLLASSDTGSSDLDNVTGADNPLEFTVTAEASSRVLIKNGETVIDDFIMPGSTTATRALILTDGTHLLSAEAFDAAGNRSHQSEELLVTVDRSGPIAKINGPYSGNEASPITFTASGSTGGAGSGIALYEWDLDFDGLYDEATGITTSHTWYDDGIHSIGLKVTDALGSTDTATTTVTVINVAPDVDAGLDDTIDEGGTFTSSGDFTDPGSDTWTATVDYGDGTGPLPLSLSGMIFSLNHTYADNGTFTVTVTVTDDDSGSGGDTAIITVSNVAPTASFGNDAPQDEGSPVTVSFTGQSDPGTLDTFTYSFDWDNDGTYDVVDQSSPSAAHTWYDNGSYTVGGRIRDDDGGFTEYTTGVTVDNVAPTATLGNDGPMDEGSVGTISFSGQYDPGTSDTFTYSFDLDNDGTYEIVGQAGASTTHSWPDNGSYTVKGRIMDNDGGSTEYTTLVTVNNVGPVVDAGAGATIDEGDTFSGSGSFADPGSDTWTATVDYGDGTGAQSLSLSGKTFSLSHSYADNGAYTVTIIVSDDDGVSGSDTVAVTVNNVAPFVDAGPDETIDEGDTFTRSGSFTDPGSDTWTALVNYGDGSGSQILSLSGMTFSLSHTYVENGTYTLSVSVTDDDSETGSDIVTITVNNVAPSITPMGDKGTYPADPVTIDDIVWMDSGSLDTHAVTIDWDDGTVDNLGTVVSPVVGQTHTYAAFGSYTVTVTVTDDDGGAGIGVFTILVIEDTSPPEAVIRWDPDSREFEVVGEDDADPDVDVSRILLSETTRGTTVERVYEYTLVDDIGNSLVLVVQIFTGEGSSGGYLWTQARVNTMSYNGGTPIIPSSNYYYVYYTENGGTGELTYVRTRVYSYDEFRVHTSWTEIEDTTQVDEWPPDDPFTSSVLDGMIIVDLKTDSGALQYDVS
jgi:subtilisin-like proprotein convertase family protein